MRALLFSLLIGLGLVAYQADADLVDEIDAAWQASAHMHDEAHRGGNDHEDAGHGSADCDHTMACGIQATCSPAVITSHDDLSLEHGASTCLSSPPVGYDSQTSPPASPPPRV